MRGLLDTVARDCSERGPCRRACRRDRRSVGSVNRSARRDRAQRRMQAQIRVTRRPRRRCAAACAHARVRRGRSTVTCARAQSPSIRRGCHERGRSRATRRRRACRGRDLISSISACQGRAALDLAGDLVALTKRVPRSSERLQRARALQILVEVGRNARPSRADDQRGDVVRRDEGDRALGQECSLPRRLDRLVGAVHADEHSAKDRTVLVKRVIAGCRSLWSSRASFPTPVAVAAERFRLGSVAGACCPRGRPSARSSPPQRRTRRRRPWSRRARTDASRTPLGRVGRQR